MKKKGFIIALAVLCIVGCKEKNVPENDINAGALTGCFTINDDGEQIVFAQGNLQYQATTKTWRFALNQYDIIGQNNTRIASDYDGWIDLFGWGTGNNPTITSTINTDYAIFSEWGANKISNGGNTANLWRTLTKDEWNYLVYSRSDDTRGSATVNGVHGYVFLPDLWTTPEGLNFTPSPNNWNINVYSATEWTAMEDAGAVFLPATGSRDGNEVQELAEQGEYWSSTPSYAEHAFRMVFGEGTVNTGAYARSIGRSVRLVKKYNAPQAH